MNKTRLLTSALLISVLMGSSPAHATTSTINPASPAQNSALSSATLRANFLAAYNDINTIFSQIGSTLSGSTTGQILFNNAGVIGGFNLTGDCTLNPLSSGSITCATIGGLNPFNSSNQSSGTLPPTRLPFPTLSTIGGVEASTFVSHQFLTAIGTSGQTSQAQPGFTDISGTLQASQFPALTGDISTTAGSLSTTLATVNSSPATYGSASSVGVVTVNAKGLVTAGTSTPIAISTSQISGLGALAFLGAAPANTLSGNTLGTNILFSSLTQVGTLNNLTVANPINGNILGNAATVTTNANLTGDVTSIGNASTLATVNGNVGSFGSSTSIPTITVNGKGLVTAASGNAVIAPAGTLSGTALASNVISSSLTSLGTIITGVWNGTPINLSSYASGTLQAAQEPAHTGDVTNTAGSLAMTLATVNSNTGSFGSSTAIPVITLNAKGLATAASTAAVVAPAGTVTGTTLASNVVSSSLTSLGTLTGPLNVGTPAISDTGVLAQFTSNVAGYNQVILQNTNTGSAASASYVVNNNSGTSTTFYGEFGMNGSAFTGTGAFNQASAVYLDSQSGDLALGTLSSNKIHFVVNNGATDAMTIGTTGTITVPAFSTAGFVTNSAAGLLSSTASPAALSNILGNPSIGSYGVTCTSSSACAPSPILVQAGILQGSFIAPNVISSSLTSFGLNPSFAGLVSGVSANWTGTNNTANLIVGTGGASIQGNVGIGTTAPAVALVVNGVSGYTGTAPTCSTGCSSITSSPASSNSGGSMVSSASVTSVTLNFATTGTGLWTATPKCTISDNSTAAVADISAISTSALTVGLSSALSGVTIYWICQQ